MDLLLPHLVFVMGRGVFMFQYSLQMRMLEELRNILFPQT